MIDLKELEGLMDYYIHTSYAEDRIYVFLDWLKVQQGEANEATLTPFGRAWAAHQGTIKVEIPEIMTPEDQAFIMEYANRLTGPILPYVEEQQQPSWSSTPPAESGWYWCRSAEEPEPIITRIHNDYGSLYSCMHLEFLDHLHQDRQQWEWWPIPLSPPEVNT